MIKVVVILKRRRDISLEEFSRNWVNAHAEIAEKLPGLRKYVISPAFAGLYTDEPEVDGIAELWFDSLEAARAAYASPEGVATKNDAMKIASSRIAIATREHIIAGAEQTK